MFPTITRDEVTLRVWVGCLACYNEGRLVGQWVDAIDADEYVPCKRVEFGSPHEEWWCFDLQGFEGIKAGEMSPSEAARAARAVETLREELDDQAAFEAALAWADNQHMDVVDLVEEGCVGNFRDAYMGTYESAEDWAWSYLEDTGMLAELPEWAQTHSGALVLSWLQDAKLETTLIETDLGVAVFSD